MGHTRKSTHGTNSEENAHPHVVNDNYVQTHNGVIKNIWPMCNERDVSHVGVTVDSIGLANLIEKFGPKPILDEYKGTAALAFTWKSNPEALYLYHGQSREKKDEDPVTERPLFCLYQPEGFYYSSIRAALDVINTNTDPLNVPFILKHNTVFEVINGEITPNRLVIEREDNNITSWVSPPPVHNHTTHNKGSNNYKLTRPLFAELDKSNDSDLICGEAPLNLSLKDLGKVVYYKGRYGRVIRGSHISAGVTTVPVHGELILDKQGIIQERSIVGENRENIHYFISGVMIRSKDAYKALIDSNVMGHTEATFKILSAKSQYPIMQIRTANYGTGKNLWYWRGQVVRKESFTPKFSNRRYTIRQGVTKEIR